MRGVARVPLTVFGHPEMTLRPTERWWLRHLSLRDRLSWRREQILLNRDARTLPVKPIWGILR